MARWRNGSNQGFHYRARRGQVDCRLLGGVAGKYERQVTPNALGTPAGQPASLSVTSWRRGAGGSPTELNALPAGSDREASDRPGGKAIRRPWLLSKEQLCC